MLGITRFVGIVIFIIQAVKYSRHQNEQKDNFTIITFLFLAISLLCLFFQRIIVLIQVEGRQALDDPDVKLWLTQNEELLYRVRAMLRPELSYLFQNLALLFNL